MLGMNNRIINIIMMIRVLNSVWNHYKKSRQHLILNQKESDEIRKNKTWYNCARPNCWTSWMMMVFAFWISSPLSTICVLRRIFISPRANFSTVSSNFFEYCCTKNKIKFTQLKSICHYLSTEHVIWCMYILLIKDNQILELVNPSQIYIIIRMTLWIELCIWCMRRSRRHLLWQWQSEDHTTGFALAQCYCIE